MKIAERILNGIKTALIDGEATIDLKSIDEASAITGSGSNVGGRTHFDDAFAVARYANPFRMGARQVSISGSDMQFVVKTGNAASATNPFGYTIDPNSGSPNINTGFWQLPVRVISAQLPIRSAVLSDVNGLEASVVEDLIFEFSQIEASSMAVNNDQTGSTTTTNGAENGLRGLTSYNTSTTAAAFGTSGTAITNGIHTVKTIEHSTTVPDYDMMVNLANALPAQYWSMPTTAWHIHPTLISSIRKLKNTAGLPLFIEVGDEDGAALGYVFGFPVIPNPYLDAPAVGAIPLVLANWDRFLTIGDVEEMTIRRFDQTQVGFVTILAEMRMVSSIRDVFAGVYLKGI